MSTKKTYKTPDEYIADVKDEHKESFLKLRETIKSSIDPSFEETIQYNMIGYVVPKSIYPPGYHTTPDLPLPFASIASQKNFIGLYHMGVYADSSLYDWWQDEYASRCKYKLDMGKSCVRLKKMDDIPYDLIAELFTKMTAQHWIELYENQVKK